MTCSLLDTHDRFTFYVQFALGLSAASVLLFKRQREKPRRKWKIWFMDASKQGLGALLAHFMNMAIAQMFGNSKHNRTDQCTWYFINILLDTSLGVLLCYYLLQLSEWGLPLLASKVHASWLRDMATTGYYGSPPTCGRWGNQLVLWLLITVLMKLCVGSLMVALPHPLATLGKLFIAPFFLLMDGLKMAGDDQDHVELVLVMLVFPVLLNIMQFWVQDNFLKSGRKKARTSHYLPVFQSPISDCNVVHVNPGGGAELSNTTGYTTAPISLSNSTSTLLQSLAYLPSAGHTVESTTTAALAEPVALSSTRGVPILESATTAPLSVVDATSGIN